MARVGDILPPTVTLHAIQRYQSRVEDVPAAIVIERLTGPAFLAADMLGGGAVILPTGNRAIVKGGSVITVLPLNKRGVK